MAARVSCNCGWTRTYDTETKAEFNARRHVCRTPRGAPRATRRRRCARCGLEVVYENATAAEAKHWFSKHSCQKREMQMLRTALAQQRLDLIDRTPQPCHHKQANHQHGTRACYVLDKCRCIPCAKANSAAETWRERQKAYGRYHKYVPAEFVRDHLADLKAYGIGLKRVAELSGVSNGSLTKIWYGTYGPSEGTQKGCKGNGVLLRGPARRVLRKTAEAIYAVEAIPANLNPGGFDTERTPLARTHLHALVALGWSISKLGVRLGINPGNMTRIVHGSGVMQRRTVDAIEALFDELSMTLPPETTHRDRIAASRARRFAKEHGWLPPLALDDLGPDDEDNGPEFDEAAIYRRMHGDKSVRLSKAEKAELRRRWIEAGRSLVELERITGINSKRDYLQQEAS